MSHAAAPGCCASTGAADTIVAAAKRVEYKAFINLLLLGEVAKRACRPDWAGVAEGIRVAIAGTNIPGWA